MQRLCCLKKLKKNRRCVDMEGGDEMSHKKLLKEPIMRILFVDTIDTLYAEENLNMDKVQASIADMKDDKNRKGMNIVLSNSSKVGEQSDRKEFEIRSSGKEYIVQVDDRYSEISTWKEGCCGSLTEKYYDGLLGEIEINLEILTKGQIEPDFIGTMCEIFQIDEPDLRWETEMSRTDMNLMKSS